MMLAQHEDIPNHESSLQMQSAKGEKRSRLLLLPSPFSDSLQMAK